MGMFDYVRVLISLPLTAKEKKDVRGETWQTKDFDNVLRTICIGKTLRRDKSSDPWDKSGELILDTTTTKVNFYTIGNKGEWYEFDAFYEKGKFKAIRRIREKH